MSVTYDIARIDATELVEQKIFLVLSYTCFALKVEKRKRKLFFLIYLL